ncbi:MAG: hypothetical protein LAQ30_25910 [Acidobacteriia bacterium]|nr:hypothetical protein [Terriglobia bacterium]
MATLRQIEANRLNAQKSTGPRTEAGKEVSRFNALKHGVDAHSTVIPGEDPAGLEALATEYHQQFQPRSPVERYLVNTLVNCDWLRRRLLRIQAELFRAMTGQSDEADPLCGLFQTGGFGPDGLQRLLNQLSATDRAYFRALAELRRIQPPVGTLPDLPCRQDESAPASPGPMPPTPEIGFVPPVLPGQAAQSRFSAPGPHPPAPGALPATLELDPDLLRSGR